MCKTDNDDDNCFRSKSREIKGNNGKPVLVCFVEFEEEKETL